MKYSLVLTLAGATASLAGPIMETRQSKKPFLEPNDECNQGPAFRPNLPELGEDCLGTLDYCQYKHLYEAFGERYDSSKACLDAREQPPFKEPAKPGTEGCESTQFAWSTRDKNKERCLGTVEYCNKKLYEGTAETFDNPDQCIAARQGGPKPQPGPSTSPELPTEAELCSPFNGNRDACIAATRQCLGKHKDKKDIIECVHAAAA